MTRKRAVITASPVAWMFAIMAFICVIFLVRAAVSVADHVPYALDYNEGWNAYHAEAAINGSALYPAPPSLMYNNYPPLSFYAVGFFGEVLGDAIEAGRILSIVGAALTAFFVAWAARRMGCTWLQGAWGAALFMTVLLMDYDYVGMNDPQLIGHAFAVAGLALALGETKSWAGAFASALLFSIAFFIKENLFVLPLATVLWLSIYGRQYALRLTLAGAALLLAGCGLFQLAYGKSLWSEINAPRSYDPGVAIRGLVGWLELGAIPAVAAVAVLPLWFAKDRYAVFCVIYLLLSLMVGTIFYGGAGVAGNVFFDASIALALCAAVGVNRFEALARKKAALIFAACQFVPVMAGLAYLLATDSIYPRYWLEPRAPARLMATRDIAFLRSQNGPVMCSLLSLCYWAGKPGQIDVGLTGQALLKGQRDPKEVASLFASQKFAAIQMVTRPQPGFEDNGFVGKAIAAHYRLDHTDMYGRFYLRNGAAQSR